MADFTNNLLSVVIILSSMFVTIGVMCAQHKHGRLNFPSWTATKPIEQAQRQALLLRERVSQWLTKATGSPVAATPALVFPGWYITSQSKPPFPHLCNKELNRKLLISTIPTQRTQASTHPAARLRYDRVSSSPKIFKQKRNGEIKDMKKFPLTLFTPFMTPFLVGNYSYDR